jgi:uncharacterized protein RhaS with RHS repeats
VRDYDPKAGRWTCKDPLGLGDGTNVYTYVGNDPVTFVDPTGEFAQILFGGLTGAAFEALLQLLMQQNDPCHEFDWSAVGEAALIGAATGGIGEIANALKAAKRVTQAAEGIFTKTGTKIVGFTEHGVDRVIGDAAKRAGTKPQAILDALKNPLKTTNGVDKLGRPFEVYVGKNARVIVNPQTGKVVSTNPLSGAGAH